MNSSQLPLSVVNRLLELRATLDAISQLSWSFSVLNKTFPIDNLDEKSAQGLIKSYEGIVAKAKGLLG